MASDPERTFEKESLNSATNAEESESQETKSCVSQENISGSKMVTAMVFGRKRVETKSCPRTIEVTEIILKKKKFKFNPNHRVELYTGSVIVRTAVMDAGDVPGKYCHPLHGQ